MTTPTASARRRAGQGVHPDRRHCDAVDDGGLPVGPDECRSAPDTTRGQ
ncbi:hypothetical protein [Modestobacter marinus]|nr:hypothetical protein [Modestobacter marinus]